MGTHKQVKTGYSTWLHSSKNPTARNTGCPEPHPYGHSSKPDVYTNNRMKIRLASTRQLLTNVKDSFRLGRQTLLNICLQPPEHERSKDLVKLVDYLLLCLLVINLQVKPLQDRTQRMFGQAWKLLTATTVILRRLAKSSWYRAGHLPSSLLFSLVQPEERFENSISSNS